MVGRLLGLADGAVMKQQQLLLLPVAASFLVVPSVAVVDYTEPAVAAAVGLDFDIVLVAAVGFGIEFAAAGSVVVAAFAAVVCIAEAVVAVVVVVAETVADAVAAVVLVVDVMAGAAENQLASTALAFA